MVRRVVLCMKRRNGGRLRARHRTLLALAAGSNRAARRIICGRRHCCCRPPLQIAHVHLKLAPVLAVCLLRACARRDRGIELLTQLLCLCRVLDVVGLKDVQQAIEFRRRCLVVCGRLLLPRGTLLRVCAQCIFELLLRLLQRPPKRLCSVLLLAACSLSLAGLRLQCITILSTCLQVCVVLCGERLVHSLDPRQLLAVRLGHASQIGAVLPNVLALQLRLERGYLAVTLSKSLLERSQREVCGVIVCRDSILLKSCMQGSEIMLQLSDLAPQCLLDLLMLDNLGLQHPDFLWLVRASVASAAAHVRCFC
eukprot:m.6106 g.6106  ORF g.6106 m.6106 type:complete len:310 (-) comp2066_c0_seq1:87-1016(-)